MSDLSKIVAQIPRKGAEAEPIAEFPIEDRAPERLVDVRVEQALPKGAPDLSQVRIESLSKRPLLTEEEYAEKKRRLPPLSMVPHRGKGDKLLTFDQKRRDIEAYEKKKLMDRKARIDLFHAVKNMPKKWEKPKA